MKSKKAEKGDRVEVYYEGFLDDGTVFDKGEIEFIAGSGEMIKGFDNAIIGMAEGQTKKIRIEPEGAYGYPDEENIEEVPKYIIMSTGVEPEKGLEVVLHGREGRITRVGEKNVTVDFNPIFVGKPLNFKIKLIKIKR